MFYGDAFRLSTCPFSSFHLLSIFKDPLRTEEHHATVDCLLYLIFFLIFFSLYLGVCSNITYMKHITLKRRTQTHMIKIDFLHSSVIFKDGFYYFYFICMFDECFCLHVGMRSTLRSRVDDRGPNRALDSQEMGVVRTKLGPLEE